MSSLGPASLLFPLFNSLCCLSVLRAPVCFLAGWGGHREQHQAEFAKLQHPSEPGWKHTDRGSWFLQVGASPALPAPGVIKPSVIANILVEMPVLRAERWKNVPKVLFSYKKWICVTACQQNEENNNYSHHLLDGFGSNCVSHSQ